MAESEHLKDLKKVWRDSCHSMWAELLSISIAESYITTNYKDLPKSPLSMMFYAPAVQGRIDDLNKESFLDRSEHFKQVIVTNRLIILSASFEIYLNSFFEAFISARPALFDSVTGERKSAGNQMFSSIKKMRGLSERIRKFAELANARIKTIAPLLSYLDDVYMLRNVLAHRAGLVDASAVAVFSNILLKEGERVSISAEKLIELASPIFKIAEDLDKKLSTKG